MAFLFVSPKLTADRRLLLPMPLEVEAKLKVDDHAAVRERLRALGALCQGQVTETNRIFDSPDRTLLAGGRGLRVRSSVTADGRTLGTLTYKGPLRPSDLKSREEIETKLEDPQATAAILTALGFVEVVRFEKRRESWHLGDCHIELDEVPYLGCYVEIEGPGEPAIRRVQADLGLAQRTHIPSSYIALLAKHCRAHDLPTLPITFPK
ncbi:MAG TPA: class IV adenylate cyclase [Phycisphaerae bacterium]|nr:class IV adenylate cyclase [Phycisphaerae bacterium]HRY66458.1 class IV adenylate cyclase [Phycisphaerae bacterium]HSA25834.1 class IV adenylate cyclase [Phycisphaerae bacterium]